MIDIKTPEEKSMMIDIKTPEEEAMIDRIIIQRADIIFAKAGLPGIYRATRGRPEILPRYEHYKRAWEAWNEYR